MTFGTCGTGLIGRKTRESSGPSKYRFQVLQLQTVFLLALVDDRYKFTVANIEYYGRNNDGRIFEHSKLGKLI